MRPLSKTASILGDKNRPLNGSRRSTFAECSHGLMCDARNNGMWSQPVMGHHRHSLINLFRNCRGTNHSAAGVKKVGLRPGVAQAIVRKVATLRILLRSQSKMKSRALSSSPEFDRGRQRVMKHRPFVCEPSGRKSRPPATEPAPTISSHRRQRRRRSFRSGPACRAICLARSQAVNRCCRTRRARSESFRLKRICQLL